MSIISNSNGRGFISAVLGASILIGAMTFSACDSAGDGLSPQTGKRAVGATIPISTADELALIGTTGAYPASGDYVLVADLDLTNWTPITPSSNPFSGTFDGDGHTITLSGFDSAVLADPATEYLGVFAQISEGSVSDLTIDIQTSVMPASTPEYGYVGGLVGYADSGASFTNIMINGALAVKWNLDFTSWGTGILYVGGLSGYAGGVTINVAKNNAPINAQTATTGSGVRAGGLIGYGSGVILTSLSGSGDVLASGQGHNTSAGGIAGYLENTSTVTDSGSGGIVQSQAIVSGTLTGDNAYMVYAGGLVGYNGSSSTIQHSYSVSTVYAQSPYPYAGGLVGYNYGSLGGVGGSIIKTSYATGDVTASSDGDLPYAGGLAGYSSSTGSKVQDSYARGNVSVKTTTNSGYGWAGGLVGANAQDSVIERCYATGTVISSVYAGTLYPYPMPNTQQDAIAGGIVGYNYFVGTRVVRGVTETATSATVQSCAALNSLVTATNNGTVTPQDARRVVGLNGINAASAGTMANNVGNEDMVLDPTPVSLEDDYDGRDGYGVVAKPAQSVFEGLGWLFTSSGPWVMGSDGYPALR
jgi:hypothetical protein